MTVEEIKPRLIERMAAMLPEVELPRITNAQTLSELEFASYESFKDNGMDGYHGRLLFASTLRECLATQGYDVIFRCN